MPITNDRSKYKKRTAIGLRTAAKASVSPRGVGHRAAIVRALAVAGPRAYVDIRNLLKK